MMFRKTTFTAAEPRPILYMDIDGVLLANEVYLAKYAEKFIAFAAEHFEVYWLTTHCMHGDEAWAVEYVARASKKKDLRPALQTFKPTTWSLKKTDAIDMSVPFLWFDDDCFREEFKDLQAAGVAESWRKIDLKADPKQLQKELKLLKQLAG